MDYIKNSEFIQWILEDKERTYTAIATTIVVFLLMIFVEKFRGIICGALALGVFGGIIGLIGAGVSDKILHWDLVIAVIVMAISLVVILFVSSIFIEPGEKGDYCFDLVADGAGICIKMLMLCTVILIPMVLAGMKGVNERERY